MLHKIQLRVGRQAKLKDLQFQACRIAMDKARTHSTKQRAIELFLANVGQYGKHQHLEAHSPIYASFQTKNLHLVHLNQYQNFQVHVMHQR